jgi:hypothetical protein
MADTPNEPHISFTLLSHDQTLGFVHVLTGPDHLSALATLSAVSDCKTSFFLGIRWGIGHSTGLLLVGGIFIVKDYASSRGGTDDGDQKAIDIPDSVGHFFESLVGIFMLGLGVYGLHYALLERRAVEGRIELAGSDDELEQNPIVVLVPKEHHHHGNLAFALGRVSPTSIGYSDNVLEPRSKPVEHDVRGARPENYGSQNALEVDSHFADDEQTSSQNGAESITQWSRRISTKTLAVVAGIIHGLAGPGGVLGVIPAVQLHDWRLAACYLGSFCLSSTLTMGLFACTYGTISKGLGQQTKLEFQIHCFSASLSILVGITWLVLLSVGKLDDVFP